MSIEQPFLAASILLLGSGAVAQTTAYVWSPQNANLDTTGASTVFPFWGKSSTYQQVHDRATMARVLIIKGMGFRPAGTRTLIGRSWDMRLTLSQTAVSSATTTTDFAKNLGNGPTTVVFGSATSFPTFTWKNFKPNGFQPAFTIPFKAPFVYFSARGNLCWEWRMKNSTSTADMAIAANSAWYHGGSKLVSRGTGCTATGKTGPAVATIESVKVGRAPAKYAYNLELSLRNAANNANSVMALSPSGATLAIGWCAPVITPLILLPVKTDGTGTFKLTENMAVLSGSRAFILHAQFGFADKGIPGSLGLSNIAAFATPAVPGASGISRVFKYARAVNGAELATKAAGTTIGFGLSTAWVQ